MDLARLDAQGDLVIRFEFTEIFVDVDCFENVSRRFRFGSFGLHVSLSDAHAMCRRRSGSASARNSSSRRSSSAVAAAAITAGSLELMPAIPMGQTRREKAFSPMPAFRRRDRKRARLVSLPMRPT